MSRKHLRIMACAGMLILSASSVFAQRGFSPDAMFERFDQDGSGFLEQQEIENSPLRFMADRMGLDTSRGVSREQLSEAMDSMRRSFEERGGFGGGFGGPPMDFGRDSGDRGGFWNRDRDGDRPSWRDRSDRNREDRRRDDRGSSSARPSAIPEPPPRVTFDLPPAYVPGDSDRDGQIGLYEWTQWKTRAALPEFLGLDRDGDGYLTPRELSQAADAKPIDVAALYQSGPVVREHGASAARLLPPNPAPAAAVGTTAPTQASAADPKAVIATVDQQQVRQAERLFSILDRNRDGSISADEWDISRRLKPLFEKAGVDLAQPMSSEQFVGHYVRIMAADSSI